MALTPLPPAPLISDSKTVFNEKASPFVQALGPMVNEINAILDEIAHVGEGLPRVLRTPEDIPTLPNAAGRSNRILGFNAGGDPAVHTYSSVRALLNVADGATANDTNAQLRDRTTHTGFQAISTVTGLQSVLDSLASGERLIGNWNANTNTPSLSNSSGSVGDVYTVSVAGSTDLNGETNWTVGSQAVKGSSGWFKRGIQVISVDGQKGEIVLNVDSVSALTSSLSSLPVGAVVSTKGCLSIGDGGHGTFDIVASTALPVDGNSVISSGGKFAVLRMTNGAFAIEQFGAKGDGTTNDTAAFNRALARGLPAYLVNGKTYRASDISTSIGGFLYCDGVATIENLAGLSTHILRNTGSMLYLKGVNFSGTVNTRRSVQVTGGGIFANMCKFEDASVASGFGAGLEIATSTLRSTFLNCEFNGCEYHGLDVLDTPHIVLENCSSTNNGRVGLNINNYDLTLTQKIRRVEITSCSATGNGTGLGLGNPYYDNDYSTDHFGHTNGTCTNVIVNGFYASGNSTYGVGVGCQGGLFNNIITENNGLGGLLVNGKDLSFNNTIIRNNEIYGVDIGHGKNISFNGGQCYGNATGSTGAESGFLIEASQDIQVKGMLIYGNGRIGDSYANMWINSIGGTGDGRYFPVITRDIYLECEIDCTDGRRGFTASDRPISVVDSNTYIGSDFTLYTRYAAGSPDINNQGAKGAATARPLSVDGSGILVIPDIHSHVYMEASTEVQAIRPYSHNFFRGKIPYINITSQGSGYTKAGTTVAITGDGTGATGSVMINDGKVIGIRVTNFGAGYTSATVTITGDGVGAVATAQVGLQLLTTSEVQISCNVALDMQRGGAPTINSPASVSDSKISVPAFGSFKMIGRYQNWLIVSSNANL